MAKTGPKPLPLEYRIAKNSLLNESTECIEWTGKVDDWGYGVIRVGSTRSRNFKDWKAHRLAWTLEMGEIPSDLCVLHRCDNPRCVNVQHLFLGTDADNAADRESKGRGADHAGESNGRAILNQEQVEEIRRRYIPKKVTRKQLAVEYGVSFSAIKKIVQNITWKM